VVAINSPDPTIEPANIIPGPIFDKIPFNEVGASVVFSELGIKQIYWKV